MKISCFTSITFSYLAKARVLGWSLKQFHPDWELWVCITDEPPSKFLFDIDNEPFDRVIYTKTLDIKNIDGWIFKHDVVEICTAVKGPVLKMLTDSDAEKIFYIDPDIAIFNNLDPLVDLLDDNSILLTPHQLQADNELQSILDNEIGSLKWGTYNLGFVAIKNDEVGKSFANWWSDRCQMFCYDDVANGLFVDQKWCDLVPAMFENVYIVRDPGYNVASWNLNKRSINSTKDGQFMVNEKHPLRFYHFTKLGPTGDAMTRRYAGNNTEVFELWAWYKRKIVEFADECIPDGWWFYGKYSNGKKIPKEARELYRHRGDLISAFPNPFDVVEGGYMAWYTNEVVGL